MINSEEFIIRLRKIMDFHALSASAFADKLSVQRSSISHILSGRNKPSLEFVMKVVDAFKDVDLYWLLNGQGHFPSEIKEENQSTSWSLDPLQSSETVSKKEIDRIVLFFKDGSFKNYSN